MLQCRCHRCYFAAVVTSYCSCCFVAVVAAFVDAAATVPVAVVADIVVAAPLIGVWFSISHLLSLLPHEPQFATVIASQEVREKAADDEEEQEKQGHWEQK